jgi:hypothetical protein
MAYVIAMEGLNCTGTQNQDGHTFDPKSITGFCSTILFKLVPPLLEDFDAFFIETANCVSPDFIPSMVSNVHCYLQHGRELLLISTFIVNRSPNLDRAHVQIKVTTTKFSFHFHKSRKMNTTMHIVCSLMGGHKLVFSSNETTLFASMESSTHNRALALQSLLWH